MTSYGQILPEDESFTELDNLPDNQSELLAEFERRKRVRRILFTF